MFRHISGTPPAKELRLRRAGVVLPISNLENFRKFFKLRKFSEIFSNSVSECSRLALALASPRLAGERSQCQLAQGWHLENFRKFFELRKFSEIFQTWKIFGNFSNFENFPRFSSQRLPGTDLAWLANAQSANLPKVGTVARGGRATSYERESSYMYVSTHFGHTTGNGDLEKFLKF